MSGFHDILRKAAQVARLARPLASYLTARETVSYLPTHVWIEPTNHCNLHCIHCPTGLRVGRKRGRMEIPLFRRLIGEIAPGANALYLHLGGESLLHPDLPEMVSLASEKHIPVGLFNNGTMLTEEKGRALIEAGIDWIGFSVDGADALTFEAVRKGAKFDKVMDNLEAFLRLRNATGRSKPYTYLGMNLLPGWDGPEIRSKIGQLRDRLRGRGLDHFEVAGSHDWAGGIDPDTLLGSGGGPAGSAGALASPPGEGGDVPPSARRRARPSRCPAPWSGMAILWDGTAVACCLDIEGKMPLGDVNDQSVAEVWNSPPWQDLRRRLGSRRWEDLPPLCRDCHVVSHETTLGVSNKAWTELRENLVGM